MCTVLPWFLYLNYHHVPCHIRINNQTTWLIAVLHVCSGLQASSPSSYQQPSPGSHQTHGNQMAGLHKSMNTRRSSYPLVRASYYKLSSSVKASSINLCDICIFSRIKGCVYCVERVVYIYTCVVFTEGLQTELSGRIPPIMMVCSVIISFSITIIRGGKLSWLDAESTIGWKTSR